MLWRSTRHSWLFALTLLVPHALRGNAFRDALRQPCTEPRAPRPALRIGRGASRTAFPRWSVGTIRLC
ncbi:DUF1534 domain-containing protein [Pseudomonas syringae pv. tomato]|nr:DUF1534 domain-containing protein [Pseudomonas syringae pv. tomato]